MQGLSLSHERYANLAYSREDGVCALAGVDSKGSIRKSVDPDELSVLSILTYPTTDLAGDFVNPQGCGFSTHAANPAVDVEHSRSPEFGGLTVAWCRESLDKPDAPYAQEWRNLRLDDGNRHLLPVAKSYFDRNSKPSMQVFALIERDILPGVSLEFKAISGRPLGPSPLERRPAYHFDRVEVVKYTHCATPVNPGALTVTKSLDALIPVVQSGKMPGGETLDPTLLGVLKKTLSTYTPKRVLVAGGFVEQKAMPGDEPETIYDDATPEMIPEMDGGDEAPAMGGIAALYAKAQALLDACDQNETDMQTSDSPELRKFATKMRDKIAAIAEEIKAMADKHDAKLNGGGEETVESDEATDGDGADEPEETDMDRDDDGVLKAIRPVYRKSLLARRAKRFTKSEVLDAPKQDAGDGDETLEQAIARIQKEDPAQFKRIAAAASEVKRVSAWAD